MTAPHRGLWGWLHVVFMAAGRASPSSLLVFTRRKEERGRFAVPSPAPGCQVRTTHQSSAVHRCPGPSEDCCWGLGSGTGTFVALNFHSHSDVPACSRRFVTARLPSLLLPRITVSGVALHWAPQPHLLPCHLHPCVKPVTRGQLDGAHSVLFFKAQSCNVPIEMSIHSVSIDSMTQ